MTALPDSPLSPTEFFGNWLPQAFAEAGPMAGSDGVDVKLGVHLEGEGGGEWVVHLADGKVDIQAAPRGDAAFTFVQSVEDWSGALWQSRGGALGKGASLFFRPGALKEAATAGAGPDGGPLGGAPSPKALAQMEQLSGLIQLVVSGDDPWSVGLQLGPGPIPEEPTTTVSVSSEDAAAMEAGELDPMTAFMSGKIQVQGDMTLMMQMQAIQMQVAQEAQDGNDSGA